MISDEIIKVLDDLGEKFGIVIDWTQQNIQPYLEDLCQRVTQYKLSSSIVGLVFGAILLVGGIIYFIYTINVSIGKCLRYSSEGTSHIIQCVGYIISIIAIIIGVFLTPIMIDRTLMYANLPEKALIELIQSI